MPPGTSYAHITLTVKLRHFLQKNSTDTLQVKRGKRRLFRLPNFCRIVLDGLDPGEEHVVPVAAEHVLREQDQVLQPLVVFRAYQPATTQRLLIIKWDKGRFAFFHR